MKFIFMERAQMNSDMIRFPGLKRMRISQLPKLESVTGILKCSTTSENDNVSHREGRQVFFSSKMTFPSLEELNMTICTIVQLWEVNCKEMSYYLSFNNLKILKLKGCYKLEVLGSLSIATALVQLRELDIRSCSELKEVVSHSNEETKVDRFGEDVLPSLETVYISNCGKLQTFLSGDVNNQVLKLSSLQDLFIEMCPNMQYLSSGPFNAPNSSDLSVEWPRLKRIQFTNLPKMETLVGESKCSTTGDDVQAPRHQPFFNGKITFPLLEELDLKKCKAIVQLWEVNHKEMSYYSKFKNLKKLRVYLSGKHETLGSFSVATALVHLNELFIYGCVQLSEVISSKEETEVHRFGEDIFPSLEQVSLNDCPSLEMFIAGNNQNQQLVVEFKSLKTLRINRCRKMQSFSYGTFKAPKLNQFIFDESDYFKQEIKDINSFMWDIWLRRV